MLLNLIWAMEVCGGVWSVAQLQRKGHAIGLGAGPGEAGGAAAINCLIMPSLFQYSTGTGWERTTELFTTAKEQPSRCG